MAPIAFVAFFAVWVIFDALGNDFAMFLNGAGVIRAQVSAVMLFIVLVLPMKLVFINYFDLMGIPLATLISYVVAISSMYGFVYRKEISDKFK